MRSDACFVVNSLFGNVRLRALRLFQVVKYPYGGSVRLDGPPTKAGSWRAGVPPLKVVNRMPEGDERPLSERESESKREEQGPLSKVSNLAPLLAVLLKALELLLKVLKIIR